MISNTQRFWCQFRDVTITWTLKTRLETTGCGPGVSFPRTFTPNSLLLTFLLPRTVWLGRTNWLCPGSGKSYVCHLACDSTCCHKLWIVAVVCFYMPSFNTFYWHFHKKFITLPSLCSFLLSLIAASPFSPNCTIRWNLKKFSLIA